MLDVSPVPPDDPPRRWPGQLSFDPSTTVLPEADPVCSLVADRWAMIPVTFRGDPFWYGFAPVIMEGNDGDPTWGWYLLPREHEDEHGA